MKFYILLDDRDIPMIAFHMVSCTCIFSCVTNNTLIVYAVKEVVLFSQLLVKACNRMCTGAARKIKLLGFM